MASIIALVEPDQWKGNKSHTANQPQVTAMQFENLRLEHLEAVTKGLLHND